MKKLLTTFLSLFSLLFLKAQGISASNGEQFMTWNLKIYVVLAVLFIILIFLFVFLFSIERRLKELEQKQKS